MGTRYDQDIAAWAQEQAALLRDRQWEQLDFEHIAEEIAELNLLERHELAHRYVILLSHLLKWRYQPERRCSSWRNTIHHQRSRIERLIARAQPQARDGRRRVAAGRVGRRRRQNGA